MTDRGDRFNTIVGEKLEELIRSKGRSRRSVALEIGIDPVTLMNYVRGTRQIPVPVLVDACENLGVTPYDFFIQCYFELGAPAGEPAQVQSSAGQSQSM